MLLAAQAIISTCLRRSVFVRTLVVGILLALQAGAAPAQADPSHGLAVLELFNENKDVRRVTTALRELAGMSTGAVKIQKEMVSSGSAVVLKTVSKESANGFYVSRTQEGFLAVDRAYASSKLELLAVALARRPNLKSIIQRFMERLNFGQRLALKAVLLGKDEAKLVRKDGLKYMKNLLKQVTRKHVIAGKRPGKSKSSSSTDR